MKKINPLLNRIKKIDFYNPYVGFKPGFEYLQSVKYKNIHYIDWDKSLFRHSWSPDDEP